MAGRRGFSVWIAAAVLPVLTASGACAQDQTPARPGATDTNTISQVFQDASSEACDAKNGSSPNVDGYDPAYCMKQTTTNGKCAPIGGADTTLAGQAGNNCYYCQPKLAASLNVIVVPMDLANAAYKQGFQCSAVLSDAVCYLACYGTGKFAPPAGTMSGGASTGGGTGQSTQTNGIPPIKNENARSPLVGHLIYDYSDACHPAGVEQYDVCDYPNLPRPAGCVCPTKAAAPTPAPGVKTPAGPTVRKVPDWTDTLTANATTILQNAGRISKAMTDSMDVTKHNNVGITVAAFGYLGAVGKLLGTVARQLNLLAAAKALQAAQATTVVELSNEAAAESGAVASQAEQAVTQLGKTGGTPTGGPTGTVMPAPPVNAAMGGGIGNLGYQTGMVLDTDAMLAGTLPAQGETLNCAILSCARMTQILQQNSSILQAIDKMWAGGGKMNPTQMVAALQKIGIGAQVGTDTTAEMTAVTSQLQAGNPVIAGVYLGGTRAAVAATGQSLETAQVHALVLEGLETQAGVAGVKVYDPMGWVYWQPLATFEEYFTQVFVHPL